MRKANRMTKPWHACRLRDDLLRKKLAALEHRLAWVNDQICKMQFAQRLLAEDPDGWQFVPE